MTTPDENWFVARYDEFVTSEGDEGAVLEKSRDAVAHRYADDVETGVITRHMDDLVAEGRQLFDRHVGRARSARRDSLKKDIDYLLDALADGTILGPNDPAFSRPYPLGDGRDKILGLWTADDWRGAVNERNSNAVAVAAKAHEFQVAAGTITDELRRTGARTTSELFS